ncbi:MAG: hypothetical protein ABSG53_28965, partial [Thermoguttaceae bacterium]
LHIIVEAGCSHTLKVAKGPYMLADRGLHVLRRREVDVLPPGIAQQRFTLRRPSWVKSKV